MRVRDRSALESAIEDLIAPLGGTVFGDIAVELFETRHRDGLYDT